MAMSLRKTAKMMNVSPAMVCKVSRLQSIARERGCSDEFQRLIDSGKTMDQAARELFPDIAHHDDFKRRLSSFKSTARKLLFEHEIDPYVLAGLVLQIAEEAKATSDPSPRP